MLLSLLWHALFFTALLSAGLLAFALITWLERVEGVNGRPQRLRLQGPLLTALGLALATLPLSLAAAPRWGLAPPRRS